MALNAHGVGADGLIAAAETLARPSEEFGNDERVEALWAIKAMEHAEVYFNLLCSVDPAMIPRLSPCDDDLYKALKEKFPKLNVQKLTESDLKSPEAKKEWRTFCDGFKHVDDFSFATLLRLDSAQDYSEENSIIVTKIQFYAIEVARNREGHNNDIRKNFKPTKRKPKATGATSNGDVGPSNLTKEVEFELQQILGGQHPLMK